MSDAEDWSILLAAGMWCYWYYSTATQKMQLDDAAIKDLCKLKGLQTKESTQHKLFSVMQGNDELE